MSIPAVTYARPPVIERAAAVFVSVDEDTYETNFPAWRKLVEEEFPVYEPVTEWLINFEPKEGKATIDPLKTELRITPRFSKRKMIEGFEWSIRCPRESLIINMESKPGTPSQYNDLRSRFSSWLSRWVQHFKVEDLRRVNLHYVNLLNPQTIPELLTPQPGIPLDKILNVFVGFPGRHRAMIPPLNCQVTFQLEDREDAVVQIILASAPNFQPQPAVRLDLVVETSITKTNSVDEILDTLDWCHERIIEHFEAVFTDAAKQNFKPIHS